ncbi:MAG: asparaginase [Bacteroidaceae bacterium]|nr:asparaginase [Bacteroidaceae bacterium]
MMPESKKKNSVLLIYTGGTIGMGENAQTGALEPLDFDSLLECVPELNRIDAEVYTLQFDPPIDSSDMRPDNWAEIVGIIKANYEQYDGFVILHGTDTMAYTASALSFMMRNLAKPVVLTGSQLPIGKLRTDGKENLITSIEVAVAKRPDGRAMVPEVCIYFSGKLLRGNRATKINAEGFAAFDSFNYPHLGDAGVNIEYHEGNMLKPDYSRPPVFVQDFNPNVVVLSLFPGMNPAIISHVADSPELRAIVMRSYGSGNAPKQEWVAELLRKARERDIIIVNVSQCLAGRVEMTRYGTGLQLSETGVIGGSDATVEATVTKLMVLLGSIGDTAELKRLLMQSLAGEI